MKNSNQNGNTSVQKNFSTLFDELFQDSLSRFWGNSPMSSFMNRSQVPVNIRETEKEYQLQIVAPGLKKNDFKIDLNGNHLQVSFEHKEENKEEDKEKGWLRQEYKMQSFSRNFSLDESVDADKIKATYEDGVLNLNIPKKEDTPKKSKTIEVR